MRRPFKGHCERCGQEYVVERGGSFSDSDYYELHREYQELQVCITRLLKLVCGMQI